MANNTVRFDAPVRAIAPAAAPRSSRAIVRLPPQASKKLPSRGQVAVTGTINGHDFATVLEPDGASGHWLGLSPQLRKASGLRVGDVASIELAPAAQWPEPEVPPDLQAALSTAPDEVQSAWADITPMARWEWVRWVNATNNPDTRARRVEVSVSKLESGKRRPCCFNLAACTDPELARNGKLHDPG